MRQCDIAKFRYFPKKSKQTYITYENSNEKFRVGTKLVDAQITFVSSYLLGNKVTGRLEQII